jgi:hypothetical protein
MYEIMTSETITRKQFHKVKNQMQHTSSNNNHADIGTICTFPSYVMAFFTSLLTNTLARQSPVSLVTFYDNYLLHLNQQYQVSTYGSHILIPCSPRHIRILNHNKFYILGSIVYPRLEYLYT